MRSSVVLAQQTAPGIEKLDPPTRAVVLMALLGLVLLGITLVACIMIGGRWARRQSRRCPGTRHANTSDASASRPRERADKETDVATSDTIVADHKTDQTRTD